MSDEIEFTVHSFPVLDSGIGIEAGYASDAEMLEAAEAERALMSPAMRELADKMDAEAERWILGL
jgi:hypothetical protein